MEIITFRTYAHCGEAAGQVPILSLLRNNEPPLCYANAVRLGVMVSMTNRSNPQQRTGWHQAQVAY